MKKLLHHLFLPHESNNHRARILHHDGLAFFIICILVLTVFVAFGKQKYPQVLGSAVDISSQELLSITNQKRQEAGLEPLTLNAQLEEAALEKAHDMFTDNYWAHNGPHGQTPWTFIQKSGYSYVYAGENLARGFTNAKDTINAWMASPTHRENVLSPNYQQVGFSTMKGDLTGEKDTVLIVEMFGGTSFGTTAQKQPENAQTIPANTSNILGNEQSPAVLLNAPRIDSRTFTKYVGFIIVCMFLFVLLVDIFIIKRKKIVRVGGHSLDHAMFLGIVLLLLSVVLGKGAIF